MWSVHIWKWFKSLEWSEKVLSFILSFFNEQKLGKCEEVCAAVWKKFFNEQNSGKMSRLSCNLRNNLIESKEWTFVSWPCENSPFLALPIKQNESKYTLRIKMLKYVIIYLFFTANCQSLIKWFRFWANGPFGYSIFDTYRN